MQSNEDTLRVLTFNVWGLKYLAKNRLERIHAIANALKDSDYDIISFQELWADYGTIKRSLARNFPHSKFWHTAAFGSGLAIFSKYRILESNIYPFSLNGCPSDLAGDWFAGKAFCSVIIAHPLLGEVEIYNTHFFARGGEEGPESRRAVRISNAWEISKHIRSSIASGRHVITTGDLNSSPHSLPMQIMFKHANLIDSWAETHGPPPSTPIGPNTPTNAAAAMETFGLTVDTPLNTWSHGKPLDGFARRWLGKRLDYILFRSPFPNSEPSLKIQETKIVMTEKVPGYNFSLSDHFGLEATFTIQSQPTTRDIRASAEDSGHGAHEQVRGRVKLGRLPEDGLMAAISALSFEYREAQGRAHRHLAYFGGCVGLLLFVLIGSAWVGHRAGWVAPVATLLGGLATWWGTTSLYVGFVYGRWERGILDNLIEEIEAVRYAGLRDIESSSHVMRGY